MKSTEFVKIAKDIATNYKTLYVMGCFGSPLNAKNKKRFTTNSSYNKKTSRTKMINNASEDTFGFDCVCLIKGILWGWNGNLNHVYGGAKYKSNGVQDIGADTIIKSPYCENVSTDFSKIEVGEIVWLSGHVGIYIGNSEVVECTPAFKNKVQITKLSQRKWKKHGKLKYIEYVKEEIPEAPKKTIEEIAQEVIDNKWGTKKTKPTRKERLTDAGYNYSEVQAKVNEMLHAKKVEDKSYTYTVVKGDYLVKIGKKTGVKWTKIAKDNNIKFPYIIRVGQKLVINK